PSPADMADGRSELIHHRVDLIAEEILDGRTAALVGDMEKLDAGAAHEELERKVVHRSIARRRSADLARVAPCRGQKLVDRVVLRIGSGSQHERRRLDGAD